MSRTRFTAVLIALSAAALRPAPSIAQSPQPPPIAAPRGGNSQPVDAGQKLFSHPISLSQFEQAAQIATLAAEHGMYELSQRAILEALGNGPPLDPQTVSGLGRPGSSVRTLRRPGSFRNSRVSVAERIWQTLRPICEKWRHGSSAEQVYETLASVALPERRPREIFLYGTVSAAPAPASTRQFASRRGRFENSFPNSASSAQDWPNDLARLLVEFAVRAGRGAELRRRVEALAGERNAEFAASVLLAQLAVNDRRVDIALAWRQLERLCKHEPPVYARSLLRSLAAMIDGPELPEPMAVWLERMLAEPDARQRFAPDAETYSKLLLALARWQFSQHDEMRARRNLELFQDYSASAGSPEDVQPAPAHRETLLRVAREFAKAGALIDACDALAKYVDVPSAAMTEEPTLAPTWLTLRMRLLEELSPEERYQRLLQWTMPSSERGVLRLVGCFVPHDHRPPAFATDLYRSWPPDEISSNFDLLVAAARESAQLEDLEQRLAAYANVNDFEALALDVLVNQALGNENQMRLRVERFLAAQQLAPSKPEAQAANDPLAAYLLTRTCLRSPDLRDLGRRLAALVKSRARAADREAMAHLDSQLAAAVARDFQLDPQQLADAHFAHWRPVRAGKLWTMPSYVPQWWTAHDGYLRCLSGTAESSLVFNYPLLGSGEMSVDLFRDGVWGSIGYGGLLVNSYGLSVPPPGVYWDRAVDFPVLSIDQPLTPLVKRRPITNVSRWTVHVEPGKNQVLCNGEVIYEIPQPSPAAPWPALCAWSVAPAVFRGFSLKGDWRIPREVTLIQGDRLTGWIGGFYAGRKTTQTPQRLRRTFPQSSRANMPRTTPATASATAPPAVSRGARRRASATAPATAPPAVSRGTQRRGADFRSTSQPAFGGRSLRNPRSDQSAMGGWGAKEGLIVGAYLLPPFPTRPSPSRLSYYRPLRNGESLQYEFFYQPERTMVHPALDRLTFLLEPDGVRLHWMTDHPEAEAGGLRIDNVADEPNAKPGPSRLPFVEGEWNRLKLSLADDKVAIELNGHPIYQRQLERANDRQFSFFHYQDQTEARMRNVVLRGEWPDRLPVGDELFAPGRKLTDAERQVQAKLVAAEQFLTDAETAREEKQP